MHKYKKLQELIKLLDIQESHHWLGNYGAESAKLIKVFSTCKYFKALEKRLDKSKIKHNPDKPVVRMSVSQKSGKKWVSGGPGLKGTQSYPPAWGKAVFKAYKANQFSGGQPLVVLTAEAADAFIEKFKWDDSGLPNMIRSLCS